MKKLFLMIMVLILIGCESQKTAKIELDIEEQFDDSVILGINGFGQNMLEKIYEDNSESNIVFSPLSCTTALVMLENGASGESKEELRNVLGINSDTSMNETYYSLMMHFEEITADEDSLPITISSNNSLWYNDKMKMNNDFETVIRNYFDSEISDLDFSKDDAKDEMNEWVSDKTKGLIKEIVSSTEETDVLYLINTLYFNGRWSSPFAKSLTDKAPFYLSSGEEITVDMMHQEDHFDYYENNDFQMIRLSYGRASMYVVLPKESMDKFMMKHNDFQVLDYREKMTYENVGLFMPKYEIKNNLDLIPMLKTLGLSNIFDYETAELDKMMLTDEELAVSKIVQNARIIVDEEGTEAAAATAITANTTAMIVEDEPKEMICDQPFMFVIKDEKTQTDLFIGILQNPNK